MELSTTAPRPISMMRKVRGFILAGLLAAALAGCGTYVAVGSSPNTTSGTSATGCAGVDQATKVTVIRAMHLVEPTRAGALEVTQTNPATVRALFRDFCQVIAHKATPGAVLGCPNEIGLSYGGTFYDGTRSLASYTYAASGCEVVTVTASANAAKPQSAVVMGSAAAAAPDLHTDMDKALGLSDSAVFHPQNAQADGQ